MTKDITFHYSYRSSDTSQVKICYGGKQIFECSIFDDDAAEFEGAVLAVQNEILKDAMKGPATIVIQPGATLNISQPAQPPVQP